MWMDCKLTEEEQGWNSYRGENGLPPIKLRRYPYTFSVSSINQSVSIPHFTSRRARVFAITWTGDVSAFKVSIATSTGEKLTVNPCHIPLLCGHSIFSTYTRLAVAVAAGYPAGVLGAVAPANSEQPGWVLTLDPNFVLPGNVALQFDYILEDRSPTGDLVLNAAGTYTVNHMVHQWEFPGFQGGSS